MKKSTIKYVALVALALSVIAIPLYPKGKPKYINVLTGKISYNPEMGVNIKSMPPYEVLKIVASNNSNNNR